MFIDCLKQARSEGSMNLQTCVDYPARQRIKFLRDTLVLLASLVILV